MGLVITKNTVTDGLQQAKISMFNRVTSSLKREAKVMLDETSINAPVDTSRLANSLAQKGTADTGARATRIRVSSLKDMKEIPSKFTKKRYAKKKDSQVFKGKDDAIGELTINDNEQSIRFGTKVPYAAAQEFGTSKIKGKYYFTNAYTSTKAGILQRLQKDLEV